MPDVGDEIVLHAPQQLAVAAPIVEEAQEEQDADDQECGLARRVARHGLETFELRRRPALARHELAPPRRLLGLGLGVAQELVQPLDLLLRAPDVLEAAEPVDQLAVLAPFLGDLVELLPEDADVGVGVADRRPVLQRIEAHRPHGVDALGDAADLARMRLMLGEHQVAHRMVVPGPAHALLDQAVEMAGVGCGGKRPFLVHQQLRRHPDGGFTLLDRRGLALLALDVLAARAERGDVDGAPVQHAAGDELAVVGARGDAPDERPEGLDDGIGLGAIGVEASHRR